MKQKKLNTKLFSGSMRLIGKDAFRKITSFPKIAGALTLTTLIVVVLSCQKIEQMQMSGGNGSKKDVATAQTMGFSNDIADAGDAGDEFMIPVLGDTQNYEDYENDPDDQDCQTRSSMQSMISWIVSNKTSQKIKYVVSVGDITDNYGSRTSESDDQWVRARTDYDPLFAANIPFGVVPGNHDVDYAAGDTYGTPGHTQTDFPTHPYFYTYFSRSVYVNDKHTTYNKEGFPNPSSNQNHIDVVNMGPSIGDVAIIYLRWQHWQADADDAINWAYAKGSAAPYNTMKKIIVTHYVVTNSDADDDGKKDWGQQGYWENHHFSQSQKIYDKFKTDTNFFMMLGGHVGGDGWRQDTYNGKTVKSFTTDYSGSCTDGGYKYLPGLLRTMKFSAINDRIEFKTFSPTTNPPYPSPYTGYTTFTRPWFHNFTTSRTNDYDNNGNSEPVFYDNGTWTIYGITGTTFGTGTDIAVPGDYDGNGKTDIATYTPVSGLWKVQGVSGSVTLGTVAGDIPTPGDFDGNGTTDYAFYRPGTRIFYYYKPSGFVASTAIGVTGDIPVPMDYDGDGKVDYATFNPTTALWTIPGVVTSAYGANGDIPVPGDYLGKGRNSRAVYKPGTHEWYVSGIAAPFIIGVTGDIPVPGDYNGDGKTDIAVYHPADGKIQVLNNGVSTYLSTGVLNGKPLNLPYAIRKFFF